MKKKNKKSSLRKFAVASSLCFAMATPFVLSGCSLGENGKSAYEIAIENGFTGTQAEWLESLKQKPVMTIDSDGYWCVDGVSTGVKAQGETGAQGATGPQGETGAQGETGPQGVGISKMESEYFFNSSGKACIKFTVTYTNGRTEDVVVVVPNKPVQLDFTSVNVPLNADDKFPTIRFNAMYEDDEPVIGVLLTRDMIINGTIHTNVLGENHITVAYNGYKQDVVINVYDPETIQAESIWVTRDIIMIKSDSVVNYDYSNYTANVRYEDDSYETLPLSDSRFTLTPGTEEDGCIPVQVSFKGATNTINVWPKTEAELSSMSPRINTNIMPMNNYRYGCFLNESPFGENDTLSLDFDGKMLIVPLTMDMLVDFDNTTKSEFQSYNLDATKLYNATNASDIDIRIAVYELSDVQAFMGNVLSPYRVGDDLSDYLVGLQHGFTQSSVLYKLVSLADVTFEDPTVLTTVGRDKMVNVTYEGQTFAVSIDVYDTSISNVRYTSISNANDISVAKGSTSEEVLAEVAEKIVGLDLTVVLYEPINNKPVKTVEITENMIDVSGVSTAHSGTQKAYVEYQGYKTSVYITITGEAPQGTPVTYYRTNGLPLEIAAFDTIQVYQNGVATLDNRTDYVYDYELLEDDDPTDNVQNVKVFADQFIMYFTVTTDAEDPSKNTIDNMVVTGSHEDYTLAIMGALLEVYDDNMAVLKMNMGTYVHVFTTEVITEGNEKFVIIFSTKLKLNDDHTMVMVGQM